MLALPGAHLHLYGKDEARPGRKMGHLTVTAASAAEAEARAGDAARRLGLAATARGAGSHGIGLAATRRCCSTASTPRRSTAPPR